MKYFTAFAVSLFVVSLQLILFTDVFHGAQPKQTVEKDLNWAIQGELSHLDCDTQPGTHPWFNNISPNQRFFMGCRQQAVIGPAVSDPDAPPPSPELLALIHSMIPHSTSEWKRFDTLHAAALYGAARLEQCSHYYECAGFITMDTKGKYAVSPVRTDYISDSVNVVKDFNPSNWKIQADFHSHPCLPHHYTGLFSQMDMIGSITERTTAYMVDLCTGDVHEFIPGVTKPDSVETHDDMWLSAGKIIGHVEAFKDAALAHEGL